MSNGAESYVELMYFSPFDIDKIPDRILEIVHEQALGHTYDSLTRPILSIREVLNAIVDPIELQNGIRKELIKSYSK
jgi:dTDP-4-dehydrorhamnose reductase